MHRLQCSSCDGSHTDTEKLSDTIKARLPENVSILILIPLSITLCNTKLAMIIVLLYYSAEKLQTEQCVQTAALLSLVGVGCLVTRQWHSTVHNCADTMCSFLKRES